MVGCRFHQLLAERQVQFDGTCASALKALVLAVSEYLTRMQGPEGTRELQPHMESAVIAVMRHILMEGSAQASAQGRYHRGTGGRGGQLGDLRRRKGVGQHSRPPPAEQMAVTVMAMVAPVLQYRSPE
jgi:hypothetical protein